MIICSLKLRHINVLPPESLLLVKALILHVVTWLVNDSGRCFIPDAAAPLGLALQSDKASPSVLSASSGVVGNVLGKHLDAEGQWGLSDIPVWCHRYLFQTAR